VADVSIDREFDISQFIVNNKNFNNNLKPAVCMFEYYKHTHTHTQRNEYIENVDDSKRNFVIKSTFLWQAAMWKTIFTQKFSHFHFHSFHYSTPKGIMIILRLCATHKRVSITINMRHL